MASRYCDLASPPFDLPRLVCKCDGPPSLLSGTGIPEAEGKLCRRCGVEPAIDGTVSATSVCVLARSHRGRHSWQR